ncbi:MAG: nucleotide sugar dehydrogenase, partial [Sphingomonadales bacterium]
MSSENSVEGSRVAVIGLGYVGLPLAAALARHFPTVGVDIDQSRVDELRQGHDRT